MHFNAKWLKNGQKQAKNKGTPYPGMPLYLIIYIELSQVSRPERAEAPSPGHRPGLLRALAYRPVRAKALKLQAKHKAFALTGRLADCHYTQGDALG